MIEGNRGQLRAFRTTDYTEITVSLHNLKRWSALSAKPRVVDYRNKATI